MIWMSLCSFRKKLACFNKKKLNLKYICIFKMTLIYISFRKINTIKDVFI